MKFCETTILYKFDMRQTDPKVCFVGWYQQNITLDQFDAKQVKEPKRNHNCVRVTALQNVFHAFFSGN